MAYNSRKLKSIPPVYDTPPTGNTPAEPVAAPAAPTPESAAKDPIPEIPYYRTPALSPDGQHLVFNYAYNLWMVNIAGGTAERLTAHPNAHCNPRFSPDGSLLAFGSNRTSGGEVYVLPMNGGSVRQLTFHSDFCSVEDWSTDGQHVYYTSDRDAQGDAVYRVSLDGGTPILMFAEPNEDIMHVTIAPDGQRMALNIPRNPWWRVGSDPFGPCFVWLLPILAARPGDQPERPPEALSPYPLLPDLSHAPFAEGRWPIWGPDGQGLYFVSDQSGNENIWYQPLEGGEARQITHFASGRVLWPTIARNAPVMAFEHDWNIWHLDLNSGESAPIPIRVRGDTRSTPVRVEHWTRWFSELEVSPDGKKVAFIARGQVFADFADKETDKDLRQGGAFPVTNNHARQSDISWGPDSNKMVYVSDREGEEDLYAYDFQSKTEVRLTFDQNRKESPRVSPDENWVAYFCGLEAIYLFNTQTGETRPFAEGNFVWSSSLAWSPDSQWLAYISHDAHFFSNVYVQHINETTARQITFLSNIMGHDLLWSPDGKFLIFTSGQYRTELQIARVDLALPAPFLRETEFEKLFAEESHKPPDESLKDEDDDDEDDDDEDDDDEDDDDEDDDDEDDDDEDDDEYEHSSDGADAEPSDHADGEAGQTEQSHTDKESTERKVEPVQIVFEGIERRLRFLTPIQMDAEATAISPDSRDLLFLADVADKVNIWTMPLDEPRSDHPPQQLTSNRSYKKCVQFAPNGKVFYYLEDGQITIRKFPSGRDTLTLYTRGEVTVNMLHDKRQVFQEAWRLLRDMFYDATFRGQDWAAIRERFEPVAMGAQTLGDFMRILNLMVGELRTSHMGAFWRGGYMNTDGYTGLFFDPLEQLERGVLRVAALVPESPAARMSEPPRIGEYLVAVNGTSITPHTSLDYLLQRTEGRRVVLRLAATPEGDEARDVTIRPIDDDDYSQLCYRAWVAANKAYVTRVSEGRLGYVHVPDMSYQSYQEFLVNLDAETYRKEGVVLDIRYNGGGHISTFILDVLTRRSVILNGFRDRISTDAYHHSGNRALNKPTILVTNEESASDAEIFTELYRRLGLGQVVGKPTAGAVIGTTRQLLLNGIMLRLPLYSVSTPEGENLEGRGRSVDIDVTQPPGERAHNHDYQLDAAIATLLDTLGAHGENKV